MLFSQLENTDFVVLRLAEMFFGDSVLERRCVVEGIRVFFKMAKLECNGRITYSIFKGDL